MDDVVLIVRAALPTNGGETTYPALHQAVLDAGKNVALLPGAIRQLKGDGFLRQEVGKRAGDAVPVHRIIRIGA